MSTQKDRPNQFLIKQKQLQAELDRRSKLFRQILIANQSLINYQLTISSFNFSRMLLAGQQYSFAVPYTYRANTSCQLKNQMSNKILNFILNPNGEIILADQGLEVRTILNGVLGHLFGYAQLENNGLIIKV